MRGLTSADEPSAPEIERYSADRLLAYMVERFHPRLALACSFQKEEAVLLDMMLQIAPTARVFTIDTGVLFEETRIAWHQVEERYGITVEVFDARRADGQPWTAENCCEKRKVAALEQALAGLGGWITGVRREQAPTRETAPKLTWDARRSVWKANPLADWTEAEVWDYVRRKRLPYNALHDRGYASIGCAPCTAPGSGRDGRWAGTQKTECGLHLPTADPGAGG
jgi:phosphoadenosine phosphosulfate reductase